MPKKLSTAAAWPSLAQERLNMWGRCIHAQRLQQRITAADLAERPGISQATLRRLERGDPGAGAGAYLAALLTPGLMDEATPPLDARLWQAGHAQRVRPGKNSGSGDGDYF
jgi:hypothetical protein